MTTDSLKLILEYRAIQEIDRILQRSGTTHETELIGLRARVIRRQEILRELTALARVADGVPSNDCPMKHEEIRWNPYTQEWFCVVCGRTSDHTNETDARTEIEVYECQVPTIIKKNPREE